MTDPIHEQCGYAVESFGAGDVPYPAEPFGATFSPCRTFRYALWRDWNWQGYANRVAFVGLNPSTADENVDDPTIRRCIGFAKAWGFGGIVMLNLYGFRATDPKAMLSALDRVGPGNDEELAYQRTRVGLIVAAWGAHAEQSRATEVCKILAKSIYALGSTKSGMPKHPLYLAKDTKLELYWSPPA